MKFGSSARPARTTPAVSRPPSTVTARPARRRAVLGLGAVAAGTATVGALAPTRRARAQTPAPTAATVTTDDRDLAAVVAAFAGGAPVRAGRVRLEIAELVDNGNAVPLSINVTPGVTAAERVVAIAVFNERNPQRDVAVFHFGPYAGRAAVATRIRLATSQKLVAVAKLADGSCWSHTVDVLVTLAACIE